jgi:hypothetical protein
MSAEEYWNQILARLGATNETILNWQADLRLEPEFAEVMRLATPEKRAEYDYIYQTCLYNLMLQRECDGRKMELAKAYRDGWADRDLFDRKHYAEEDMDEFQKSHLRKNVGTATYIGIPFHVIGFLIYALLMIIVLIACLISMQVDEGAQAMVLIFGCLVVVPHGVIANILVLTFSPIVDIVYSSVTFIIWVGFFILGCIMFNDRTGELFTVLFFAIAYPLIDLLIPLIFTIFALRTRKRKTGVLGRLKQADREIYNEYLSDYSDIINQLNESFAMQLNLIQADCEGRKHHPEAALFNNIPQYYQEFCAENEEDYRQFAEVLGPRRK